ncbi:MAG TPA: hypothetical protein VJ770_16425 [Stellaceae bacterium]|nr:hypothetical protein [Stellaceae bacterium]
MTYRVSYVDTAPQPGEPRHFEGRLRDEYFPTEPAALARARELLDDVHCHTIVVSDGAGEPLRGVRLQLKAGVSVE